MLIVVRSQAVAEIESCSKLVRVIPFRHSWAREQKESVLTPFFLRHIRKGRTDAKTKNLVLKLEKMFRCVD